LQFYWFIFTKSSSFKEIN